jgi:4-diphosphocytidyl-2-C-methyl-D-erythritol kinase
MTPLRLEAPAKINLSLAVAGRRADGMHELASDLVLLELADRLLLMPGSSGLRVDGATGGMPATMDNLAWRGLLAGLEGEPQLECLTLEKRIPVAAGLGGGSSDAAAGWRLARRWRGAGEEADQSTLEELGRIGADVPFFAARLATGRVTGIGERVEPAEPLMGRPYVVLAHPPFSLSTAAVFGELRPGEWSGEPQIGVNDLLAPARRLRPELDEVFRLVAGAGGDPHLSGSGPTVYSLTEDRERAAAVVTRLNRAGLRASQTRIRSEPASIEAVEPSDADEHGGGRDAEQQE